ncbi:MAG TPA: tripartite tricarboxylate transporter TctB family protein [bacterium]|nr:tripartite tricarboxylate transporter TctB family protein [bacterium]
MIGREDERPRQIARRVSFAVFVILGAAAWEQTAGFGSSGGGGSALLPRVASGGIMVLGLVGLAVPPRDRAARRWPLDRSLFIHLAYFAAYGILMPEIGFVTTTVALAVALVVGFGGGVRAIRLAIAEAAFVAVVYVVFTRLFQVQFPRGLLP